MNTTKRCLMIIVAMLLPLLRGGWAEESKQPIAPDFTLPDINGKEICLDSLLEQGPVFMTFWALWCDMCIKELDAIKPYYNELDSMGINMLAISVDKSRAAPKVKPFAMSHKWKYVIVRDPDDVLLTLYNVQITPSSFIIDQEKRIVFVHQGYKPGDEEIIIEKLRSIFNRTQE